MRLGGWVKTEKVNYRRDAIVELTFSGEGLHIHSPNTIGIHLSAISNVRSGVPPGLDKGTLTIKFYGSAGTAWIDGLRLESVDEPLIAELPKENRYDIVEKRLRSDGNWAAPELPYRITGSTDDNSAGAPVMGGSRFCETIAGGGAKPARRSRFRTYFRRRHGWKENRLSRLFRRSAVVAERPLPAQRHPQVESPEGAAGYRYTLPPPMRKAPDRRPETSTSESANC